MTTEVTPLALVPGDNAADAGGQPFVREPGDRVQYVDLDGYATLVWFAEMDALHCGCGGRRVQDG